MADSTNAELVLLDLEQTKRRVGAKSDATIYSWIQSKGFPRPITSGKRFSRWVEGEVMAWIQARIKERDARLAA